MSYYPAPAPRRPPRATRHKTIAGGGGGTGRRAGAPGRPPRGARRRPARAPRDKRIAGPCAGSARRYGISTGTLRLAFVVSCILPGPQFIAYLVLWALMPRDDRY